MIDETIDRKTGDSELTSKSNHNGRSEDLYVITENGEQCFMWRSGQLTYIAQDRHELPQVLAARFGRLAKRLDLSYNSLTSFKNINKFTALFELILDNNNLKDEHLDFTLNLRLKTLSLNKNKLRNLCKLVNSIKVCFPNLEYLSLIGNPLCPGPFSASGRVETTEEESAASVTTTTTTIGIDELVLSGQDFCSSGPTTEQSNDFDHKKYRHFILYHLPNLRFLDSIKIVPSERDEALRRCFYLTQLTNEGAARTRPAAHNSMGSGHHGQDSEFGLTIISSSSSPLDATGNPEQPTGVFSKLAHRYTGKNSEGNRFIRNQDL